MRKTVSTITSILCALMLMLSSTSFAHSGRTDSNGGHWNRKTGTYHYHNGGGSSSSSYTPATEQTPVSTPKPFVPSIVGTDIRTYMNGYEMPTWAYNGTNSCAVIIAEDLKDYGFDTYWDGGSNTLTIVKNNKKQITPIPMDSYRNLTVGSTAFNIQNNNVNIVLKSGDITYSPANIFNLGGYMAISIDELKLFGGFSWNGNERTVTINSR